jgi:DNA repair protein RadD
MINRHYQSRALDEVRGHWSRGVRRVLLSMPTGAGKTHVFCQLCDPGTIVCVRGVKLIAQASARLSAMGVEHGILQGANTRDTQAPVVVASIDTLARRSVDLSRFHTLIIDEAHLTEGKAYERVLSQWQGRVLAVTATPWLERGMGHVSDVCVEPITMRDLTAEGSLVPLRYFAVSAPDLRGVTRRAGEFDADESQERVALAGCPVDKYREHGEGRQAIVFVSTLAYGAKVASKYGEGACLVHGEMPDDEREAVFARFHAGELRWLVSVGVLTTGVDLPPVSCLVMARPTMSEILWVQMLGRGTRLAPGKTDCLVLDLAGNTLRLGFACDPRPVRLERLEKRPKKLVGESVALKTCKHCYAVVPSAAQECPACRQAFEVKRTAPRVVVRSLSEIKPEERTPQETAISRMVELAKAKGHKKGSLWHRLREKFGAEFGKVLYMKYVYNEPWPEPRVGTLTGARSNWS